ncbi:hypothetical protein HPP92_004364 [Vanilla planifolia]|uniref:Myb-like domain-containing protein n=1 Tax=Vanilla planifolia TaxID=51239 RepID=A0A835RJC8_VANPL|nr:hypothetical protein HPP92_004364 [Vanilla planifolia]
MESTAAARSKEMERIKGPWSPEEDEMLQRLVNKLGARTGRLLANRFPGDRGSRVGCGGVTNYLRPWSIALSRLRRTSSSSTPTTASETSGRPSRGYLTAAQITLLRTTELHSEAKVLSRSSPHQGWNRG